MKKIILLILIAFLITACSNSVKQLNVKQAKKLLDKNEDVLIIDVRTKEEYDLGHIKNAILIPYDQIENKLNDLEEYKNKKIMVYCRTKNRSEIAAKILIENGFTNVYQMTEGYSNWQ